MDLVYDMTGRNDVFFQLATALLSRNLGICTNEAQDSLYVHSEYILGGEFKYDTLIYM